MIDRLTHTDHIRQSIAAAVERGEWLSIAIRDAARLTGQYGPDRQWVQEYAIAQYKAAGLDTRGRKQ